ncbi:hypothetical protein [Bacillus mycoides]|uniref:hypothetical protein n=1 Tax=Bacillus mycoides TaxID=1405 RepID=UPI003D1F07B7
MNNKEIAKELTIAFLEKKPNHIGEIEDLVTVYEKFFEAVHRSDALASYVNIMPEDFVRNNK